MGVSGVDCPHIAGIKLKACLPYHSPASKVYSKVKVVPYTFVHRGVPVREDTS